ncbi:hypothetical protein IAR50_006355 [Cryptococcus sp. DSM 104548]
MLHTPTPLRLLVNNKRRHHLSPRTSSFTFTPPATPSLPLGGTSLLPSPAVPILAPQSPSLALSHNPRKRPSTPQALEAGESRVDCHRPTKRIRSVEDKRAQAPLGLSLITGASVEHGTMEDIEMRDDDRVQIRTGDDEDSFGSMPSYQASTIGKPFPTAQPGLPSAAPSTTPLFPPLPALAMRRSNPKKLCLSLPSSSSSTSSTPTTGTAPNDSSFSTPYTPGPPRTPALAMSMGRSTTRGLRRPSLLSLITQPPSGDEVPPTPSVGMHPYATMRLPRTKGRARSQTAEEISMARPEHKGGSWSATPLGMGMSVHTIEETENNTLTTPGLNQLGYALPSASKAPSDSSSSTSLSASTNTTPSTSPPLPASFSFSKPYPVRQAEPYEDGPIEVVPGVWLGAEESVWRFGVWAVGADTVRIVNVAQEIDDPFDPSARNVPGWSGASPLDKGSMKLKAYPAVSEGGQKRPEVEYCHVRWSHGELGLADLPEKATLGDVRRPERPETGEGMWKFWEAIRWMEEGRKSGTPVLIHCQCGVSRSATLTIAYIMALAAAGTMPEYLGHIRSMQDAYDFVKNKSSWIGPNHSLVFQLVDFARNLTSLLSLHYSTAPAEHIPTSFPTSADAELSEAEWARRRREFDESEHLENRFSSSDGSEGRRMSDGSREGSDCMSPEEAGDEARRLDEAMVARRALREAA